MLARILFALLFLTMSMLQPGPYGAPGDPLFHDGGIASAEQLKQATSGTESVSTDAADRQHAPGNTGKIGDKNCEIHCAPMVALLIDCRGLEPDAGRCLAPRMTPQLLSAEHASPIRPPRLLA